MSELPTHPGPRLRPGRPLAWAAGIAAGLLAAFLAGQQLPPAPPAAGLPSLPVSLTARRGEAEAASIHLGDVPAGGLTLLVETRLPPGRHTWELAVENEILAAGPIDLVAGGSELRALALPVPRAALARGGHLTLRILPAGGASPRLWTFHLDGP